MPRNLSDAARERQREAQKAWREKELERFALNFKKGELERYRRLAQGRGESLTALIRGLLKKEVEKEYGPMKMRLLGSADSLYPSTGSRNVDVWELEDGRRICVSEWNGLKWLECWEIFPDLSTGPSFTADPVYRFSLEGTDPSSMEENSPEWCRAVEIVGIDF